MTKVARVCHFCEEPFQVDRFRVNAGYGKYCSKDCYHKSTRNRITKSCLHCGKQLVVRLSEDANGNGKYCSRDCYYAHKGEIAREHRTCLMCGNGFPILKSWIRKGGGDYCSNACKFKSLEKPRVPQTCKVCGKEFTVHPYREKDASRGQYCSKRCYYQWRSENIRGENSPNWRGGPYPYGPGWDERLRETIRERDDHTCGICHLSGKTVHHIDYIKENLEHSNLVTLCPPCHGATNFNRAYWTPALSALVKARLQYAGL